MRKLPGTGLLLLLTGCICACSTANAPVSARKPKEQAAVAVSSASTTTASTAGAHASHTVSSGDTLFSIAWRYGHDYKTLAAWNRIKPPFVIYPGQVIRLQPDKQGRAVQPPPVTQKQQRPRDKARVQPQTTAKRKAAAATAAAGIRWQWPARGRLLKPTSPTAQKGISISGRTGQKIVAAATGEVVYSGSGLRGYGKLIIIKHNDTYLSAYAYNRELIVKEGEMVTAGQQISTMGLDGKGAPVLHFEIRKNGKPIDPLRQLPRG